MTHEQLVEDIEGVLKEARDSLDQALACRSYSVTPTGHIYELPTREMAFDKGVIFSLELVLRKLRETNEY